MKKSHRDNSKYKYIAALVFFAAVAALMLVLIISESNYGVFTGEDTTDKSDIFEKQGYKLKENIETFLVIGLDKFEQGENSDGFDNDKQADFLMLLAFDNDKQTCTAIHLNRDTMTDVDILDLAGQSIGTENMQIALAHTYGNGREVSCRNTSDAVSRLLYGVKIDGYVSLTMDSVAVFNDLVGGVEVEILDDFTGVDDTLVKGEKITLKGEQALRYVRSRSGMEDSSNISRMARQRQYLYALLDKTNKCVENDPTFLAKAAAKLSDSMISNHSVNQLQVLGDKFAQYELAEISDVKGESKVGEQFMEFYPDKDFIEEIVLSTFYEK